MCSYATQLSVLYLVICKFPSVDDKFQSIPCSSSLDKNLGLFLLLTTILLKFFMGYMFILSTIKLADEFSDLPMWYFKRGVTFSGPELESVLFFAMNHYLSAVHMDWVPLSLLLGYSMMIRQEFLRLRNKLCEAFSKNRKVGNSTKLSQQCETLSFSKFSEKFGQLSEVVEALNETFFSYILVTTVTIIIHIIYGIRSLGLSCSIDFTIVSLSIANAVFGFFVLCLSGEMISSVVSLFVLFV